MMPELPEKPPTMEVRRVAQASSSEPTYRLMEQWSPHHKKPLGLILGKGCVNHWDLPSGWVQKFDRDTRTLTLLSEGSRRRVVAF
jgi:hypothetical protein